MSRYCLAPVLAALLFTVSAPAAEPAKKLKVCLVSGSFEYNSADSLAAFQTYLEKNFPVECSRAFATSETAITGLDNLASADAAIFFTRRLRIDAAELAKVKKFVESGKPILGVRTASHGFQDWLEMDKLVFGGDYRGHLKAGLAVDVSPLEALKTHPVAKGVRPFRSAGSLYQNPKIADDTFVLLTGKAGTETHPVAWVREKNGRRVFYTSLGHQDDFKNENFIRLLVNALAWATKVKWELP